MKARESASVTSAESAVPALIAVFGGFWEGGGCAAEPLGSPASATKLRATVTVAVLVDIVSLLFARELERDRRTYTHRADIMSTIIVLRLSEYRPQQLIGGFWRAPTLTLQATGRRRPSGRVCAPPEHRMELVPTFLLGQASGWLAAVKSKGARRLKTGLPLVGSPKLRRFRAGTTFPSPEEGLLWHKRGSPSDEHAPSTMKNELQHAIRKEMDDRIPRGPRGSAQNELRMRFNAWRLQGLTFEESVMRAAEVVQRRDPAFVPTVLPGPDDRPLGVDSASLQVVVDNCP